MLRNPILVPWPGPGGFGDPCGPAGPREAVPDCSWMVAATPGDVFRVVVVVPAYAGPSSHCRIEQMLRNVAKPHPGAVERLGDFQKDHCDCTWIAVESVTVDSRAVMAHECIHISLKRQADVAKCCEITHGVQLIILP